MGSAAGAAVQALDGDDAQGAFARRRACAARALPRRFRIDRHGPVFADDFVGAALGFASVRGVHGAAFQIDGGAFGAQVEADGAQAEALLEDRREQVLAGVLLHVVEAAGPIDGAIDRAGFDGRRERCAMARLSRMRSALPSATSTTGTPAMEPVSKGWPPEAG